MLVLPYGLQRAYDSYFVWVSANIPSPYSYCTPRMQFQTNYQAPWKKSGHRFRHKNITNHIGRIVVKSNKLDLTTPRSQSSPHIFKEWYLITHIHFIFKINKYQKKIYNHFFLSCTTWYELQRRATNTDFSDCI